MVAPLSSVNPLRISFKKTTNFGSKKFESDNYSDRIADIIERDIDIESITIKIENLRNFYNWSNYEIAHFYLAQSTPNQSKPSIMERILKHIPVIGKAAYASYKARSKIKERFNRLSQYINSIAGIALTYDPVISNIKELYVPISRSFLYAANPSVVQKFPLMHSDPEKLAKIVKFIWPQIAKKLTKEFATDFASGLAEGVPPAGGLFSKHIDRNYKDKRNLLSKKNLTELIYDYEKVNPTPKLETIKKAMFKNNAIDHQSTTGNLLYDWYINRDIVFLMGLCVCIIPPIGLLLIYGLWRNQSVSGDWLWYTDKRTVITYLIIPYLLPVGLYGVAKTNLFSYGPKWYDNRAYAILMLLYLAPFILPLPLVLYTLVKTKAFDLKWKILISLILTVLIGLIFV